MHESTEQQFQTWPTHLAKDCPGIEIEPGVFSGCTAKDTGAIDCPVCRGRTDDRQVERGITQCWQQGGVGGYHGYGAGPCFDKIEQARAYVTARDDDRAEGTTWRVARYR